MTPERLAALRARQKATARANFDKEVSAFGPPTIDKYPGMKLRPTQRAEMLGDLCPAPAKVVSADECGTVLNFTCPFCCENHEAIFTEDMSEASVPVPCGPWRAIPLTTMKGAAPLPDPWKGRGP